MSASMMLKATSSKLSDKIECEDNYCKKAMQLRRAKWRIIGSQMKGYPVFNVDMLFPLKEGHSTPYLISKNLNGDITLKLPQTLVPGRILFANLNNIKEMEKDNNLRLTPSYEINTTDDLEVEGVENVHKLLSISRMATIDYLCFKQLIKAAVNAKDNSIVISGKEIKFKVPNRSENYCIKFSEKVIEESGSKSSKKRANNQEEEESIEVMSKDDENSSIDYFERIISLVLQVQLHQSVRDINESAWNEKVKWSILEASKDESSPKSNLIEKLRSLIYHMKQTEAFVKELDDLVQVIRKMIHPTANIKWIPTKNNSVSSFRLVVQDIYINGVIRKGKLYVNSSCPIESTQEAKNWIMAKVFSKLRNRNT